MRIDRLVHVVQRRLSSLVRGRALDHELNEELQYHLDRLIEENTAHGLAPDAARREALLAIGGLEQRKEQCRDTRRVRVLENLVQDSRYAMRSLLRVPEFTIAALLTLTVGIGATVAVFTVVNGVLLRPLPFPHPDRLFLVALSPRGTFVRQPMLSDHNYVALRGQNHPFASLATFATHAGTLLGAGEPAVVPVAGVTTEFFSALGVAPAMGRAFHADEGQPGAEGTVVLSHRVWRARFAADHSVLGRQITVDGVRHVVIGVMPSGFDFPARTDLWIPRTVTVQAGNSLLFPVFGRLKPDVSVQQARAQFDAISAGLPQQPDGDRGSWYTGLVPLEELLVGDIRRPLQIFGGAVILVLLIACANVANLLLARGADRRRELSVRAALGASRRRLAAQLLTESSILALAGGLLGIGLSQWMVRAVLALAPEGRIPRLDSIRLDAGVVLFALGASLATGLLFGWLPARRLARDGSADALVPGTRTFGAGQERLRGVLAVGEIALALILLTGAALMLQSFLRLRAVDPGFDTGNVISLNLDLPDKVYSNVDALHAFEQHLLDRLKEAPGVAAVGSVNWRPLGDMHLQGDFRIQGRPAAPDFNVTKPAVSPGYFAAMGITLVRGRDFASSDNLAGAPVAIVSQSVAKSLGSGDDVLGKQVSLESTPGADDWMTIVGIVEDVRQLGPAHTLQPAIYRPYLQVRSPFFLRHLSFLVRTASDPAAAIPALRAALRSVDGNQPARSIVLMDQVLASAVAEPRFHARLLGSFAVAAAILAILGTYGVLAYSVSQRTHEIGVRMALGARPAAVVWMVISRTTALGLAGVAVGSLGAWLTTRLLETFLFGTTPTDPAAFAAAALVVFLSAAGAGLIPAYRATCVDPIGALRHE